MTHRHIGTLVIAVTSVFALVAVTRATTDQADVKAPNGIALSEFKGYDGWAAMAPSQTDESVKVIAGNPVMITASKAGIPDNGKPVPDGAMMAKIEWAKKSNDVSPYAVNVPGTLKTVSFMVKDSKRFPDTNGWGYAQFIYDAPSSSFKPYGTDGSFAKTLCHKCHTTVKDRDYVYTHYAKR